MMKRSKLSCVYCTNRCSDTLKKIYEKNWKGLWVEDKGVDCKLHSGEIVVTTARNCNDFKFDSKHWNGQIEQDPDPTGYEKYLEISDKCWI